MRQKPAPEFLNGALKLMGTVMAFTVILILAMVGGIVVVAEIVKGF
jgi:hypothetical protein